MYRWDAEERRRGGEDWVVLPLPRKGETGGESMRGEEGVEADPFRGGG
jgi:hypothetical protein